jgi:hypothetical protein
MKRPSKIQDQSPVITAAANWCLPVDTEAVILAMLTSFISISEAGIPYSSAGYSKQMSFLKILRSNLDQEQTYKLLFLLSELSGDSLAFVSELIYLVCLHY